MNRPDPNNEEKESYAAIRSGDETAFRFFYEERLLFVVDKVQKLTKDRDEAWDIAQDTFVKLWEQREQIDPDKPLYGLVTRMALNAAHNANKRKEVHGRYHGEQLFIQTEEDHSADAKVIERETQRKIDAIIEAMPPQRRKVYRLSREEGLTYNEIAEKMNLSYGTVNKHMSIALEELRELLAVLYLLLFLD
jgi:RNA polymerase sigma-70 factor (ECF subfamily)